VPLPISVSFHGFPAGCSLQVDFLPVAFTFATDGTGTGSLPVPIPNVREFSGAHLFTQAINTACPSGKRA
jgi:hypothetical protein